MKPNKEEIKSFTIQCPVCGLSHKLKRIEKGKSIAFFCHVQYAPKFGCGTFITISTK